LYQIPCIIFAGGKSSRMGRDKALVEFDSIPLAYYQYKRLKKLFQKVYISTKTDKFDFSAPLILDSSKEFAPIFSFVDILKKFPTFFAISVDTPFVDKEIIETLLNTPLEDATVAKTSKPQPLIGVYNSSILPIFEEGIRKGELKLNQLLKRARVKFVPFKEDYRFLNLNYPTDLKRAREVLKTLP